MGIVSILAWSLGILNVLSSLILASVQFNHGKSLLSSGYMLVTGIAICASGYFLRTKTRWSGVFVIGASLLSMLAPSPLEMILTALIVILVRICWRELE